MPDIKIKMGTYIGKETGMRYWAISWEFIYDEKQYGDYLLANKENYSQVECMKYSIEDIIQQAEYVYELLVETSSAKGKEQCSHKMIDTISSYNK